MLTIRVSQRLWEQARDPELLVTQLENYLRKYPVWIWRQPARYRAEDGTWRLSVERPVMLSMQRDALLKFILRPTAGTGADYLLVALRKARQVEVYEAVTGRSLKGETFRILRPWEEVRDVAVIIRPATSYLQLPPKLKEPIIVAWDRLVKGMSQRKVNSDNATIFLLTGAPDMKAVQDLDDALADAQVGSATTDPYETRKAEELCEKAQKKLR